MRAPSKVRRPSARGHLDVLHSNRFSCTYSESNAITSKQLVLLSDAPRTRAAPKVVVLEKATVLARAAKIVAFLPPGAQGCRTSEVGRVVREHVGRRGVVAEIGNAARAVVPIVLLAVGRPFVVPSPAGRDVFPAPAGRGVAVAARQAEGILVWRMTTAGRLVAVPAIARALAPVRRATAAAGRATVAAVAGAAATGRVAVVVLAPGAARAAVRGGGAAGAVVGAPTTMAQVSMTKRNTGGGAPAHNLPRGRRLRQRCSRRCPDLGGQVDVREGVEERGVGSVRTRPPAPSWRRLRRRSRRRSRPRRGSGRGQDERLLRMGGAREKGRRGACCGWEGIVGAREKGEGRTRTHGARGRTKCRTKKCPLLLFLVVGETRP